MTQMSTAQDQTQPEPSPKAGVHDPGSASEHAPGSSPDTPPDQTPDPAADGAPDEVSAAHQGLALTKLTLAGFKSFADRTEFRFDDPITGIVGPNGCGKSNVVDAIKWVLGERSSKSLRGKEMIDVIFAGSAARKPSGMASVVLTFDNPVYDPGEAPVVPHDDTHAAHDELVSDDEADDAQREGEDEARTILTERHRVHRPLPIDTDEVEIERRLYRDGKSQYLINGRLARLKDIRGLFLDTGIGADAYSIIEQGKVDRMLLASPSERRVIFEEAAGIAKYRQRRIETQRKLEKTESNLAVTREQLDATERRLRLVKGQAAKARRFRALDDEYRALRAALAFESYDDIRRRLEGLTSQIASLEDERRRTEESLEREQDALEAAREARLEASGRRSELESDLASATSDADGAQQRLAMIRASIEDAAAQVETETKRMEQSTARLAELDTQIADHGETLAALRAALEDAEDAQAGALSARDGASNEVASVRSALDESRSTLATMERDLATARARIEHESGQIESLEAGVKDTSSRIESLESEHAEHAARETEIRGALETHDDEIERCEREIAALDTDIEDLGEQRARQARGVGELDEQRVRAESRYEALTEMARERIGLDESVRAVMEARDRGEGFGGVIAPLAELIETDAAHAEIVEAALGATLQAIVVESIDDMPGAEELATLPGRVTFLPIDAKGAGGPLPAWLPGATGARIEPLRDHVRLVDPDERLAKLLDRVLGSTLLIPDLESAIMLGAGPLSRTRCTFVTRGGTVVDPSGGISAGPRVAGDEGDAGGILSRASELHAIGDRLTRLGTSLESARGALASLDEEGALLGGRRAQAVEALTHEREARVKAAHELETTRDALGRARRETDRLRDEVQGQRSRLDDARERFDAQTRTAASLERLIDDQRATTDGHASALQVAQNDLDGAGAALESARVAVSTAHEQVRSESRHLDGLERRREDLARGATEAQDQIERARATLESHKDAATRAEHDRDNAAERIERTQAELGEQRNAVASCEALEREAAERARIARDSADAFGRDWHAVESARRETEVKRETLEERTLEDLEIDLCFEYPEYRHMMDDGGVERIDVPGATARVKVLRDDIRSLGNVNLNAIDEELNLTERNEDLIAQVRDLDEARITLATLIERLDAASRERFGEVFGRIQTEFGGRNGMFRRLFGGGRAEVRLMGLVKDVDGEKVQTDEIDLLESGIEVIAKPPGKEPRAISQLSGGEKTMTAVAMLLAIFRSKPSCFCVLDEVDAALDEANVGRFCATLDQFAAQSRFVVITHNKRTMQAVDKLFGVTMQERGVSKRVEVRLDQVGEGGKIDASANAVPEQPEPDPDQGSGPRAPTASLREALASMRETESARADAS